MSFSKPVIGGLIAIYLTLASSVYWTVEGTQADQRAYMVDIATSPASGFLKAANLAPGDRVSSTLVVKNKGNLDFNYTVSARRETGSSPLYEKLNLKITDSQGILYEGKFSGLADFPLGTIALAEQQSLNFTATLPKDATNEFQGHSAAVAFDFTAIGHHEQIPDDDSIFEPPFCNRNFALHQKSTIPIKFHLRDSRGVLETVPRVNVKLVITGPGLKGGTVNYRFSLTDGTLKFDDGVQEPHYLARFSTKDYPVLTGGKYTAAVYDGAKVLDKREFMVLEQGNRSNSP